MEPDTITQGLLFPVVHKTLEPNPASVWALLGSIVLGLSIRHACIYRVKNIPNRGAWHNYTRPIVRGGSQNLGAEPRKCEAWQNCRWPRVAACVCMCLHMFACVCTCLHVSVCVCMCLHVSTCAWMCLHVSACVSMVLHVPEGVCRCQSVCVCMCVGFARLHSFGFIYTACMHISKSGEVGGSSGSL